MNKNPEFASVESFVQHCIDDEKETFTLGEAQQIAISTLKPLQSIVKALKDYGLTIANNIKVPEGRGFTSNNHDRWTAKNGFVGGCGIGNASRQMVSHWQPT